MARHETTLDGPESLREGDEIVTTGLGGITGTVRQVHPGIFTCAVLLDDGRWESLSAFEAVTVLREEPAPSIHWLFAPLVDAARGMGR